MELERQMNRPENTSDSTKDLITKIKDLRKDMRYTQAKMAEEMSKLGTPINSPNYNKIETGVTNISLERLIQICLVVGTHPNYLLGWSDQADRDLPDLFDERLQRVAGKLNALYLSIWIAMGETLQDFQDPTAIDAEEKDADSRLDQIANMLEEILKNK